MFTIAKGDVTSSYTLRFSTCLSLGDPEKFSRYGGYSESGACEKIMGCSFGILHSGLVRKRVVIASCQIRRLVCGEEEEISRLDKNNE